MSRSHTKNYQGDLGDSTFTQKSKSTSFKPLVRWLFCGFVALANSAENLNLKGFQIYLRTHHCTILKNRLTMYIDDRSFLILDMFEIYICKGACIPSLSYTSLSKVQIRRRNKSKFPYKSNVFYYNFSIFIHSIHSLNEIYLFQEIIPSNNISF